LFQNYSKKLSLVTTQRHICGAEVLAPLILKLSTRWRWVVNSTRWLLHPWQWTLLSTEQQNGWVPELVREKRKKRKDHPACS